MTTRIISRFSSSPGVRSCKEHGCTCASAARSPAQHLVQNVPSQSYPQLTTVAPSLVDCALGWVCPKQKGESPPQLGPSRSYATGTEQRREQPRKLTQAARLPARSPELSHHLSIPRCICDRRELEPAMRACQQLLQANLQEKPEASHLCRGKPRWKCFQHWTNKRCQTFVNEC